MFKNVRFNLLRLKLYDLIYISLKYKVENIIFSKEN